MKFRRAALLVLSGLVFLAGFGQVAAAASSKSNNASSSSSSNSSSSGQGSVQGYAAASVLQIGTVVQLAPGASDKVAAATKKSVQQMYGVVVDPHQLTVTISSSGVANETYVATSGTFPVLVSNEAGAIQAGDFVTASSVDGIAMDAGTDGTTVLGRVVAGFDGKTNAIGSTQLKDSSGRAIKTVSFGIIPVSISIERNPDIKSTKVNLPPVLQRIGLAVAEKPISPVRLYLSIAITVASIIIAIVILQAGVRNAVISMGRNPLGKKTIFHGLLEIILTAILVVIVGLFAVYLLLKL